MITIIITTYIRNSYRGYTKIFETLLDGIEVKLQTEYNEYINNTQNQFKKIIYTGSIDEFYGYMFGKLEYRSLRFEEKILDCNNFQGNAVVNYTDKETPYTRIVEHKHFEFGKQDITVVTYEYPVELQFTNEPYYPINDYYNNELYNKYKVVAKRDSNVIFNGRLGSYKYYDMDKVIEAALEAIDAEFGIC